MAMAAINFCFSFKPTSPLISRRMFNLRVFSLEQMSDPIKKDGKKGGGGLRLALKHQNKRGKKKQQQRLQNAYRRSSPRLSRV